MTLHPLLFHRGGRFYFSRCEFAATDTVLQSKTEFRTTTQFRGSENSPYAEHSTNVAVRGMSEKLNNKIIVLHVIQIMIIISFLYLLAASLPPPVIKTGWGVIEIFSMFTTNISPASRNIGCFFPQTQYNSLL